ncbi:exodeoxyribonuclease VII small subunit [Carnimonas bestiolae]|uniref:exodeoxyribonuclease VII small subunit n=1 Tax=Carnimonas bestiolae TaxID=3402172 RepID=UPI003EDCA36A
MADHHSDAPNQRAPQDDTSQNFGTKLKQLEAIVERLEGGDLELEESLASFEQGVRLTREARSRLDAAELKIKTLLERDDNASTAPDNGASNE